MKHMIFHISMICEYEIMNWVKKFNNSIAKYLIKQAIYEKTDS